MAKSLFDGLTAAVLHAIISSVVRFGLLAQLVEHIVHIDGVTGSSPVQTTKKNRPKGRFFIALFTILGILGSVGFVASRPFLNFFSVLKAPCSHRFSVCSVRELTRLGSSTFPCNAKLKQIYLWHVKVRHRSAQKDIPALLIAYAPPHESPDQVGSRGFLLRKLSQINASQFHALFSLAGRLSEDRMQSINDHRLCEAAHPDQAAPTAKRISSVSILRQTCWQVFLI